MARGFLVFLLVLLFVRHAKADELLRLELEPTRGCGDAEVVRARIAERVGRDPFGEDGANRLHIVFARKGRSWTAEIGLFDAKGARIGSRALTQSACEPLLASVVFTVAVLLEDLAPVETPPERPPEKPAERPPPAPPLPIEEAPKVEKPAPAPPPRETYLDVGLGGTATLGGAPAPAAGGEALFGLDIARLRFELAGRAYLPAASDGDVAVRTRLVHGRVAACYGWVVASACAAVALGSVSAEATGAGVTEARSEGQLYATSGVGALSRVFVAGDRLFVRASIELTFALARPGFDVGAQRVWTMPAVGGAAALGLGIRLP